MSRSAVVALSGALFFLALTLAGCSGGGSGGGLLSGAATPAAAAQSQANTSEPPATAPQQQQQAPSNPAQPPAQPNTAPGNPCALLSKQDATAILGGAAVGDAKPVAVSQQNMGAFTASISACDYDATTGTGSVSLQMWKAAGGSEAAVKQMSGIVCQTKEKIAGIGDNACWYSPDHKELQAFKGGTFVSLTVRGAPAAGADDAIKALAKRIVDRVQ